MIDRLINSSLLIVGVLILRGSLGKYLNRRFTYAMWLVVAVQLLVPFSMENPFLFSSAVHTYRTVITDGAEYQGAGENDSVAGMPLQKISNEQMSDRPQGQMLQGNFRQGQSIQNQTSQQIQDWQQQQLNSGTQTGQQSPDQARLQSPGQADWLVLLPAIWIAGMVVTGGCLLLSNLFFYHKLRKQRTPEATYQGRKVYISPQVKSPCLYGLFTPAIYLPEDCVLTEEQQNYILMHEWTHYRHGDNLWAFIRAVGLTIYWFDPLVWAACHFSRKDCETACDEGVLKILTSQERLQYGRTLVDLCAMFSGHSAAWLVVQEFSGGKQELKYRIGFIRQKKTGRLAGMLVAGGLLLLTAGCTLGGQSAEQDTGQTLDQSGQTSDQSAGQLQTDTALLGNYEDTITGLPDGVQFALVDLGLRYPVLLTTDHTYDDGNGHNAAVYCDVYYEMDDGTVKKMGTLESGGTAYPIAHSPTCLYTTHGHGMEGYVIDEKDGKTPYLQPAWSLLMTPTTGEDIYTRTTGDTQEIITEAMYLSWLEKLFQDAEVVNFENIEQNQEVLETYRNATRMAMWFHAGTLETDHKESANINGMTYYKVKDYANLEELHAKLCEAFTPETAAWMIFDSGAHYREVNGSLYAIDADSGTDMTKGEESYRIISETKGGGILAVTVELLNPEDPDRVTGYQEYKFRYTYLNGTVQFFEFPLIRMGNYEGEASVVKPDFPEDIQGLRTGLDYGQPYLRILARDEVKDIAEIRMIVDGRLKRCDNSEALRYLETHMQKATYVKGGSGCPFYTPMYLTLQNGETGVIYPAGDSCNMAVCIDGEYDLSGNEGDGSNIEFWNLLGWEPPTRVADYIGAK